MKTFSSIRLETAGTVATLTLARPDKLNAFTDAMHGEIAEALDQVEAGGAERRLRALVITGAGRGFCAGQDLAQRKDATGRDLGETIARFYNPLIRRLRALEMPVVAAVNGVAAGAGMSLALAADITIAARSAQFIAAFAKIGLAPDAGATWLLPRLIGPARAAAVAMLAEPIGAERAEAWGLIWRVVDDAALMTEATATAERLATGPTTALARIKRALDLAHENTLDGQLELECMHQSELGDTADYREGVAAFLAKRPPRFSGR
jgi:2-(1,2-epoxy-1,2-dihydrophenyl)acetyl-CoA isomerase